MVAARVDLWGADLTGQKGYSCVGAAVGATFPSEASRLRKIMPKAIFLKRVAVDVSSAASKPLRRANVFFSVGMNGV